MDKETKTCPYCGEEILAKAKKCKHCGELLDGASNLSNDMKKCPFCGEMIPINSTFCNICETPLADIQTNVIPKIEYKSTITQSVDNSIMPDNVKRFNWGAFLFTWIWGISNKSYMTFWALVPYFGIVWAFVCGIKGNEWAWKNKKWVSVEDFNNTQKKWAVVGSILFSIILSIALIVSCVVLATTNTYVSDSSMDENAIIQRAIEVYHKERNREEAKKYGVSERCYDNYQNILDYNGDGSMEDALYCSMKEKNSIKDYLRRQEEELSHRGYALDDEPIWTNSGMPKSLVLKGVPIMCFEKANCGDNSQCTIKQLNTIKEFYKNNPNVSNTGDEYFEYY